MSLLNDAGQEDQKASGLRLPRQRGKGGAEAPKGRATRGAPVTNGGYKPSALLLPEFLVQARERRRLMRSFVVGAGGVGAVVVAASLGLGALHVAAEFQRSSAASDNQPLADQVETLNPVGQFYSGFATREQAVEKQLVTDVQYATVLNQISANLPAGSQINSITTVFGQTCDGPDPFAHSDGLGCVRMDIDAPDLAAAGQFAANVSALPADGVTVIYDPYITGNRQREDEDTLPVMFSATVNFNSDALSHRFAGLLSNPDQKAEPATGADGAAAQQGTLAPTTGGTP